MGYFDKESEFDAHDCFAHGGCVARMNDASGTKTDYTTVGMDDMIAAVREADPAGIIVLAGSGGWAYETKVLMQYATEQDLQNVIYNLHPYMGPWQNCDPAFDKSPTGFFLSVNHIQAHGHPVIATEFGQYCCPDPSNEGVSMGTCSDGAQAVGADYDGSYKGEVVSYNDAILSIAHERNVSWTMWAWVPGGDGNCGYPMMNVGTELIGHNSGSWGQGTLTGKAKCNRHVTVTDNAKGANITYLWNKHYLSKQKRQKPSESASVARLV